MNLPAPYRFLELTGTHRAIGEAMGHLDPPFRRPPWWPSPPDPELAEACRRLVARWHPPLIEEYEGYAAAQGLDSRFLWQQVCRTSMRARLFACSAVAWWSPEGVWVGRNYDFQPIQRRRDLIGLRPEGGMASLGMMGSVPGGRYDGVNEAGLFVSLHAVMADEPPPRPGIPFHLVPRILLERCRSAGEAVELLLRMPHMLPMNFLIADPREGFAVEVHPLGVAVRAPENGILTVTNHYDHPALRAYHGPRDLRFSIRRKEQLVKRIASAGAPPWERLRQALSDHEAPVCGHRPGFATLWSVIAGLHQRTVEYAFGPPCQTPFHRFPWPASLLKDQG
ncbi:C45 family peptidase [Thermoflexus sp.]|uniref:C45 family peptidase n=1 Tax=Thermoflexus sp. TaxID=1969742 RepID=UPI002ADE59E1|nr:C45 family peptidase [Thermoflexus sp.]